MILDPLLSLDDTITEHLKKALERCHGNQNCAAGLLGITPRKLNYMMEKRGIPRAKDRSVLPAVRSKVSNG